MLWSKSQKESSRVTIVLHICDTVFLFLNKYMYLYLSEDFVTERNSVILVLWKIIIQTNYVGSCFVSNEGDTYICYNFLDLRKSLHVLTFDSFDS